MTIRRSPAQICSAQVFMLQPAQTIHKPATSYEENTAYLQELKVKLNSHGYVQIIILNADTPLFDGDEKTKLPKPWFSAIAF